MHFELGTALTELQRNEEAYDCYLQAVRLDPALQPAFVNLSAVMEQQERFAEAIAWAEKAIALKPDCGLAHYNLANAQRELGDLPAAIASYEQAARFKPDRAKTLWNLGICHLLAGNFREGWRLFECRQDAQEVFFDRYPQPRWDGSSLAEKTIVVHAEQGIGDEILFASCIPDLIPQARQCILVCDPRLEGLFARSFPRAVVRSHLRRKDWSPPPLAESIDVQIPAGSLPLHFRSSRGQFPRCERFLEVDPALLAKWRVRLAAIGPGLKIGISWRAGGKPVESRKRTISLDHWGEIFAVPGTRFVNLQYGDASAEIAMARDRFGVEIHDWEEGDPLIDIESFAAKIAALDLVVSVGNATVHIAGAVGTPAWTLLPMVPSWRWMIAGEESPWYANVRLYRQPRHGDWGSVLQRIAAMLRQRSGATAAWATAGEPPPQPSAALGSNRPQRERPWLSAAELAGHKTEDIVAQALQDAERCLTTGDLAGAEKKYREVIQLAPRHFAALNGLGVVARRTGRTELAIRSFRRSLAMIEALPIQQLNLADALLDAGRCEEALVCYRRAIALEPTHLAARVQVGRTLQRLQRHGEAIGAFREALAIQPRDADALVELGRSLALTCRIDEAIDHLEHAAELRPIRPRSPPRSVPPFSTTSGMPKPRRHFAARRRSNRAVCRPNATGRKPSKSSAGPPKPPRLMSGSSRWTASRSTPCCRWRRCAMPWGNSLPPRRCFAERSRSARPIRRFSIRSAWRSTSKARTTRRSSVSTTRCNSRPNMPKGTSIVRRGLCCGPGDWPRAGRITNGAGNVNERAGRAILALPLWDGAPLSGRSILVHGEQGFADELLFASCYSDLIEQAAECAIVCDPRLESLLRRSFPATRIYAVARGREQQWRIPADLKCDLQIPAGSLPRHLRPTPASFPRRNHYLIADPAVVAARRQALAVLGGGLKVGIALGSDGSGEGSGSSSPAHELFQSLAGVAKVDFVDLSAGAGRGSSKTRGGIGSDRQPLAANAKLKRHRRLGRAGHGSRFGDRRQRSDGPVGRRVGRPLLDLSAADRRVALARRRGNHALASLGPSVPTATARRLD